MAATLLAAGITVAGAATAAANANPSGAGPPNQTCQLLPGSPGGAANSPGAPFNEVDGKGGTAYNNAGPDHLGAPSQYDVACYQASVHGHF